MDQTAARNRAKELNAQYPARPPHIATTRCALRGQYEQGPDAGQWIVASAGSVVEP